MQSRLLAILLLDLAESRVDRRRGGSGCRDAFFESFEYTAVNPLVVNRAITLKVAWVRKREMLVWAEDSEDGTVGMVGTVRVGSWLFPWQKRAQASQ